MQSAFDVIVVGAGPGGSSVAAWLSQCGISTLLLDRAVFPRDKVCGDGLIPKALYWLDMLGCVDEVLDHTNACITEGDLYIDSEHILRGPIPQGTPYPGFVTMLDRRTLDHILVRHAVSRGAHFRQGCDVKRILWKPDGVVVESPAGSFRARMVIGADGAGSTVSRALDNRILDGPTAASVRGYFEGTSTCAAVRLYFNREFFPGYGWYFSDNSGHANVGVGCVYDSGFPLRAKLKALYAQFVAEDLKEALDGSRPCGPPKGGWACYYRPARVVADRALLIGDAANLADPLNGGGIHTAIESAYVAAGVVREAVDAGDFSASFLGEYERRWNAVNEMDWRTGEFFLAAARNPHLREFYLSMIRMIAALARDNARFREFCSGLFNSMTPARKAICPVALWNAAPLDPAAWLRAASEFGLNGSIGALRSGLKAASRVAADPAPTIRWAAEMVSRAIGIAGCYVRKERDDSGGWNSQLSECSY